LASAVDIVVLEIIAHCGRMQQEANTRNLKGLEITVEAAEGGESKSCSRYTAG
jgi:hypothetical protein